MARFHLGNGARLERLNWLGDTSPKGLREAHGLMVNYLYDLRFIEANHEAFANEGTVVGLGRRPPPPACSGSPEWHEREPVRDLPPELPGRPRPDLSRAARTAVASATATCSTCPAAWRRCSQDLGVKPGDRVAAQVEKSAEALMLYLGSLRAGAVYLPLNTAYTAGEIRYFLGDAEPTLFVCRPELEASRWRRWAASSACRTC